MFENAGNNGMGNNPTGQGFLIGRVKDIVLGEYKDLQSKIKNPNFDNWGDLGKISFELLYNPTNISMGATSKDAYPIHTFIKQLPTIHEIVFIIPGPSPDLNDNFNNQNMYNFPAYALWNAVNHNAFPNLNENADYNKNQNKKPEYRGKTPTDPSQIPLGNTFTEKKDIRSLLPFEGDTLIESRFGQSIRLGSTVPQMKGLNHWSESGNNGDPITIIRNGQGIPTYPRDQFAATVEDINSDSTSIYLTAGQKIIINTISSFPLDSFGNVKIDALTQNIVKSFQPEVSNNFIAAASQDTQTLNKL
jgi:hypothetical protein